jgi:GNAT superfamily N-acetyltransferase
VFDHNIARSADMTAGLATRPFADSTDSLLRFAMRADATLTGFAGLAVAAAADPISSLTGLTSIEEYGLGAFFVLYGLLVFSLAALPNLRRAGIGVVTANVVFTVAAVAAVAADWLPLSAAGIAATLASGVYTALFGVLQYFGVRRVRRLPA